MSNLGDVAWRVAAAVLVLGLPIGGILTGPGYNGWIASRGESYEVTGAAIARSGDDLYVVVSGYAQRVSQRTDKGHGVTTTDFPRLTSWRVSDGEPVARRPYAPVYVRWSYVDTVVRALTTAAGRVWVVSTEPETGLHAVDPVTLTDVIDRAALEAIAPALRAGLHVEPSESPVLFDGRELLLRVESGSWLAVDPTDGAARDLGVEGREWTELQRA
ncbi:MAG TPA: hypothetical protein PKA64_12700, partial [Myxococcota bacterium]|nr:hypothetical protein [Myxococcota bacterium]